MSDFDAMALVLVASLLGFISVVQLVESKRRDRILRDLRAQLERLENGE